MRLCVLVGGRGAAGAHFVYQLVECCRRKPDYRQLVRTTDYAGLETRMIPPQLPLLCRPPSQVEAFFKTHASLSEKVRPFSKMCL